MKITITSDLGQHIEEAVEQTIKAAKLLQNMVVLKFNDKTLFIGPYSSKKDILQEFWGTNA